MRFKLQIVTHPGRWDELIWSENGVGASPVERTLTARTQSEAEEFLRDTIIRLRAEEEK